MRKNNFTINKIFGQSIVVRCYYIYLLFIILPLSLSAQNDSIVKTSNNKLKSKVSYKANDSIVFDIENEKIFLYKNAEVTYENITVKAGYIEIDFKKAILFSGGLKDSSGTMQELPVFLEKAESFNADNITYNFNSKKGIIRQIRRQEGEGYLLGNKVKKMPDNITFISSGSYTTCSSLHPHYDIRFVKAKVIPENKIVSGPAMMFIEGIPTPLAVPFGYFPINKGRKSGLIIPSYGESANRGFFLENGGFYWGVNDYIDFSFKGDIYTRGSWALKTASTYNWLYHFSGLFSLEYANNIIGEAGLPGYENRRDFFVRWQHNQSEKARPNSRFNANVNLGSSKYNRYNPTTTADYLSNTFTSSVSYSTTFAEKFNFSTAMRHSQNTQTRIVDLSLPEINFSMNRLYPFRRKNAAGKLKWYENISVNYNLDARNEITSADSLLFKGNLRRKMNNGILHSVPVSASFKVLKYLTFTNAVNFTDRMYFNYIERTATNDSVNNIITDTIYRFRNESDFRFSSSLNTRLYGLFQFKKGFIRAIRHVVTPNFSFNYTPYFSKYYNEYFDPRTNRINTYSIFEGQLYGNAPPAESGSLNFSISNNLEMKVRSKKDTVTGFRKIMLIENLTLAQSYDLAKDSMPFSQLSINGYTRLFKNIDVKYSSLWDPYVNNKAGRQNRTELQANNRLFNRQNTQWAISLNWSLSSKKKQTLSAENDAMNITGSELKTEALKDNLMDNKSKDLEQKYEPFRWSLNMYYTFLWTSVYSSSQDVFNKQLVQTLSFNASLNLTPKWKIGVTSGYDFQNHDFSYTSVNIYRDLHCWEMVFNWIPTGFRKSYNFTIRVKASVLQDLKLMRKTDWRDLQY